MIKVTYIYHSGFLVELDQVSLLFDYFSGEMPTVDSTKPLVIFSSHSHHDHYNPCIFKMQNHADFVKYVLSDDILSSGEMQGSDCTFVGPNQQLTLGLPTGSLNVSTLRSNDLGVAFVVEMNGVRIYHAGDLNNWWWGGYEEDKKLAAEYHSELEKIKNQHFKLSFVPLDPRIEGYQLGMMDFVNTVKSDYVVPIHCGDDVDVIERFTQTADYAELEKKTTFLQLCQKQPCAELV